MDVGRLPVVPVSQRNDRQRSPAGGALVFAWLCLLLYVIRFSCTAAAEDMDVYRTNGPVDGLILLDVSSSMAWPVYHPETGYGNIIRQLCQGKVPCSRVGDEETTAGGRDWEEVIPAWKDVPKNSIYLVGVWLPHPANCREADPGVEPGGLVSEVGGVLDSVLVTSRKHHTPFPFAALFFVMNRSRGLWQVDQPDSIDVDENGCVLFPAGGLKGFAGERVAAPPGGYGARLMAGSQIRLALKAGESSDAAKRMNFLRRLKREGNLFSGFFAGGDPADGWRLTDEADQALERSGRVAAFFWVTGNWIHFIKLAGGPQVPVLGGSRMQVVREGIANLLETADPQIRWGLMTCGRQQSSRLVASIGTPTAEVIRRLDTIRTEMSTQTPTLSPGRVAGLDRALFGQQEKEGECNRRFLLILSGPSVCEQAGQESSTLFLKPEQWLRRAKKESFSIYGIGLFHDNLRLENTAQNGGGFYSTAYGPDDFTTFAEDLHLSVQSIATMGVPAIPINPNQITQAGDVCYFTFFQPEKTAAWSGNLKKYRLQKPGLTNKETKQTKSAEWIVDAHGQPLVDRQGGLDPTSTSCWSTQTDGAVVKKGGAGERLLQRLDRVVIGRDRPYDFRNIYTCRDPETSLSLVRFYRDGDPEKADPVNPADLGIRFPDTRQAFLERDRIINYIYGYTDDAYDSGGRRYNEKQDGRPMGKRDWILGDIIHSRPCVISYLNEAGHLAYRFIAVGANDGMLHVFVDSVATGEGDETKTIPVGNRTYAPGDEIWAFIPSEFLPRLKELRQSPHTYFADGTGTLFASPQKDNDKGYRDQILVFGERRGGRCYWALDVSIPDPREWTVKWRLAGGEKPGNFFEIGTTWSRPVAASFRNQAGEMQDVVIFTGGYDPEEDHFPESWLDGNQDGRYDAGDPDDFFDVTNPAHDFYDNDRYDGFNPDQNEMGRGIYVVDIRTGEPVFQVSYGTGASTGRVMKSDAMKWCFPAEPTVIADNGDLVVYAADIYGRIWKAAFAGEGKKRGWTVDRIFSANPGADQAETVQALEGVPMLLPEDRGRKLFHAPDVSYFGTTWTDSPVLYFVTGDRAHPRYLPGYENRLYVVSDTGQAADETHLLNLTCNVFSAFADVNQNGIREHDDSHGMADKHLQEQLQDILYGLTDYPGPGQVCRGWYRNLERQGDCLFQDPVDHTGEMGLDRPVLFNQTLYFSTFQPRFDQPCFAGGSHYYYAVDYSHGNRPFYSSRETKNTTPDPLQTGPPLFQVISATGLPSAIQVLPSMEGTLVFACSGQRLVSFEKNGRDDSGDNPENTMPLPSVRMQQVFWETY